LIEDLENGKSRRYKSDEDKEAEPKEAVEEDTIIVELEEENVDD
jgi:hypothetical protein